MRKPIALFVTLLSFLATGMTIFGCQTKKPIISFQESKTIFNVVGYAKPVPFSSTPNLFCFLRVEPHSFLSKQIYKIVFFRKENSELCVLYENKDGEIYLFRGWHDKNGEKIDSLEEIIAIEKKKKVQNNYTFKVLDQKFILDNVECVLFNWHSGGVKFFAFKSISEGINGVFRGKITGKYDPENSGFILFSEWDKNNENWPEIKELQFPLKN